MGNEFSMCTLRSITLKFISMKKVKLKKLKLSKHTVSELGADAIVGGISGGACQPSGSATVPATLGCAPFTLPVICHGSAGCFRRG